jgi:protein-histidine pros-kinase
MSHELRTPLNAIIGFTGMLLMQLPGPLNRDQEKQLQTIRGSAQHLLSLINDLLDLAKIESGKVQVNLEHVHAQAVLEDVATTLRQLAEDKGLEFELLMPAEPVYVKADRRALSQILLNLANNAIKFTDVGSLAISLRQWAEDATVMTEFAVSDTGVGIRPSDQEKLFEAFSQVDSGYTRRSDGTGLGLHLSQQLARLLGGSIHCTSVFGHGSTFTLSLPSS